MHCQTLASIKYIEQNSCDCSWLVTMSQELVAVCDPCYVRAAAWTVLCEARIDWVVTGDVSRDVRVVAATSSRHHRHSKGSLHHGISTLLSRLLEHKAFRSSN